MDINFMCNYKGMLYPLQLDPPKKENSRALELDLECPESLVDLCAEKIVLDGSSTLRAVESIPPELCYSLMKAALVRTRDRSIEILISRWPWNVLSLSKLAKCMFTDLKALYSDAYVADRMRRGVKYTTCLAHTFVECLKKRSPTKLKYLDISGFPTAEVIVTYLSSHALLVCNEARQKKMISMYNEVAGNLQTRAKHKYQLEKTTLPEEYYVVNLDAFVQTEDAHMDLCKALGLANENQSHLKLRINKLDVVNLGVPRISVLLDKVDPEHLTGLCMQYNRIECEGLTILAPAIQRLKGLTGLDLSCNNIALTHDHSRAELLGESLSTLPNLCRMDLSNNRIRNKLSVLLGKMQQSLTNLELSACGLSDMDLRYLTNSQHAHRLQGLDISENNLGRHFEPFCTLLQALGKQLVTLETEDCCLDQTHFTHLFHITSRNLQSLRFWNMSRNVGPSNSDILLQDMKIILNMPSLETLLVSYPAELVPCVDFSQDTIPQAREVYQQRLHASLNKLCENDNRKLLNVVFVNS